MQPEEQQLVRLLNRVVMAVFAGGAAIVVLVFGNHWLAVKKEVKARLISQKVKIYKQSRILILQFRSEEGLTYQANVPIAVQSRLYTLKGTFELRVYHGIFASGVDEIRHGSFLIRV